MTQININAVAFQRDGLWIAQCLEYDFVSCARTKEDLPRALLRQITAQIQADLAHGHEAFFEFKPAPAKYWELFEQAKLRSAPMRPKKTVGQRIRQLFDGPKVDAKLFPVAAWA